MSKETNRMTGISAAHKLSNVGVIERREQCAAIRAWHAEQDGWWTCMVVAH